MRVLFPHPDVPTMATVLPWGIVKVVPPVVSVPHGAMDVTLARARQRACFAAGFRGPKAKGLYRDNHVSSHVSKQRLPSCGGCGRSCGCSGLCGGGWWSGRGWLLGWQSWGSRVITL